MNNSLNQHEYSIEIEERLKRDVREDENGKEPEVEAELGGGILKMFQMKTVRMESGPRRTTLRVILRGGGGKRRPHSLGPDTGRRYAYSGLVGGFPAVLLVGRVLETDNANGTWCGLPAAMVAGPRLVDRRLERGGRCGMQGSFGKPGRVPIRVLGHCAGLGPR